MVGTYIFKNVRGVRLLLFDLAEDRCSALANEDSLAWLDIAHVGETELSQGDALRCQPTKSVNGQLASRLSKISLGEVMGGVIRELQVHLHVIGCALQSG